MASVSIVFRKDKLNKNNEAPIHYRIIKNRKISYISSGVMLPFESWDFEKNKVRGKHKNSARLNSFITNKFAELQDQVYEHETISKSLTTRQLKEKIYGKPPQDFLSFAAEALENQKGKIQIGTYNANNSALNILKEFVGQKQLMFQDITVEFLMKYEKYLREDGRKVNTIHRHLKFVRKIFNSAVQLEKVEHQDSPFLRYKLKTEKTSRTFLTEEELKAIEDVEIIEGQRLHLHQQMFVFASYAGGLRVSDVLLLQWKQVTRTHLDFVIYKTNTQMYIKLPNKAIEILNQYRSPKLKPTDFIFPMLPNGLDLKNEERVHKEISSATAYINKNLKTLAQMAEIEKPVSFHISRHTWATRALRKGISIDKVSKLMGHAQIKETQIYAKIVNEELDKAMDVFND